MRAPTTFLVLACAALLAACGSTGSSGGGGDGGPTRSASDAPAVSGNHQVLIRTWNPKDPTAPAATAALVNASSEAGRRLTTGTASSTIVRVISDEEMGALLSELDAKGFSANATPGVTLEGLRPDTRRRGVIIEEKDGVTKGIEFVPPMTGTTIPTVYTDCKQIIFNVHRLMGGMEVRASTGSGAEDPSRVFQAPPIRMPNR